MTVARTILVVDDDQELRTGLRAMLQERGFQTLEAEDGHEARRLIEQQRPDLVILDMMMPRWGGFPVLEYFKDKPGSPRFIMMTANEMAKHKAYAEEIGVIDYIRKPFSMKRLLEGVDKALPGSATPVPVQPGTMRCRCYACGAVMKASFRLLGETRPCPRCQSEVYIQPQPPEDEGPQLVANTPYSQDQD
ncbi:MAG: response regulator [Gemmataceae bacterium]|nr:response regulator [Gemmataceae bacterium]MCI0643167.1 response regulator [Gemmataceae bacterium]MCI0742013.1 response regulator [Gemmataceae bacterium]